eukprot:3999578-Prymnesium_polylepis.1
MATRRSRTRASASTPSLSRRPRLGSWRLRLRLRRSCFCVDCCAKWALAWTNRRCCIRGQPGCRGAGERSYELPAQPPHRASLPQ